jgi:hypothetical protein
VAKRMKRSLEDIDRAFFERAYLRNIRAKVGYDAAEVVSRFADEMEFSRRKHAYEEELLRLWKQDQICWCPNSELQRYDRFSTDRGRYEQLLLLMAMNAQMNKCKILRYSVGDRFDYPLGDLRHHFEFTGLKMLVDEFFDARFLPWPMVEGPRARNMVMRKYNLI